MTPLKRALAECFGTFSLVFSAVIGGFLYDTLFPQTSNSLPLMGWHILRRPIQRMNRQNPLQNQREFHALL